jgi:hypothetical protein
VTSAPSASTGSGAASLISAAVTRGIEGAYLPTKAVTPGATNPAVTQATIGSTICRSGFTASIRPPVSCTDALKVTELVHGYAVAGNRYAGRL